VININFKQLVKKLNSYSSSALEGAAGLCMSEGHYDITLNHFFIKLLAHQQAEIHLLLSAQNINSELLKINLQRELTEFAKGNSGKPIFAQNIFEILEQAWLIASVNFNREHISSGALLLAWVQYTRSHARQETFANLNLESLYQDFLKITQVSIEAQAISVSARDGVLEKFCEDLTQKAHAQQLDPVYGREHEIRQMIDVLCRRRKNNPILIGEAGVGKTALAEGLALKIIQGAVPEQLQKVRLLTLNLGALEAGASVKGEFEHRIKNLLQELDQSTVPIIMFIDEAHLLIGAGGHDAANLLKPALARGQIRVIAATTWSEYKKHIEKDPALTRRFQLIKVKAFDDQQTLMILRGLRMSYEAAHGVVIRDDALQMAVQLSTRYIPDRQQPDKAIDLLDTAAARIKVNLVAEPSQLEQINLEIATLTCEHAGLLRDASYGIVIEPTRPRDIKAALKILERQHKKIAQQWQKEIALIQKIITLRATDITSKALSSLHQTLINIQGDAPLVSYEVDSDCIAKIVSDWTHIPLGKMLRDESSALLILDAELKKRIKGQDQALEYISEQLKMAKAGLNDPCQPMGVFLLVGPSGVGKTETALAIADILFGGEDSLITINMSEFQEQHTISRLIGSPPGYVGYGEGGRLTEAVRKRPYSVILLDEVEKASLDVLNLFYQVFDKGVLTDGEGREVDFSQSVIFLTSNLASAEVTDQCINDPDISMSKLLAEIRPILSHWFKPALLARLTIIPYKNLTALELSNIAQLKLNSLAERLFKQYKITLNFGHDILDYLAKSCTDIEMGARNIDTLIKAKIMPELSTLILEAMVDDTMLRVISLSLDKKEQLLVSAKGHSK
jgi:type VI secretion system protein VasG